MTRLGFKAITTVIACSVLLCGCIRVSDIEEIEPGKYTVAGRSFLNEGSRASALKEVMAESDKYCKKRFQHDPWIIKIVYSKIRPWSKSVIVTITFYCLGPEDPRLEQLSNSEIQIEDDTGRLPDPFANLFKKTHHNYKDY